MRDLDSRILDSRQDPGVPLPSVRDLARHFGVAGGTIHRALRRLAVVGEVHSLPRQGFFWGTEPVEPPRFAPRIDRTARVRERLVSDLHCGVYHPHRDLPPRSALAPLYGLSATRMGEVLERLAEEGLLARRGRAFSLPPPPRKVEQGTVLLAMRCDAEGTLLLETDRLTDFVKSVQREGRDRGLRIVVLGWHSRPGGGVFLDQEGREVDPAALPGVLLGCLASTWLVDDPVALLVRLRDRRVPVSVWWEHPPESFPRLVAPRGLVGFDLSFGLSSGVAAGRHVRALAGDGVAFVSPFHGGAWSRNRLEGLRRGLAGSGKDAGVFVHEEHASAWDFHQVAGGVARGERLLRSVLRRLVREIDPVEHPVWVVANDHAATMVLDILRDEERPRPRLVSFDNSSHADARQFDSFEFHTDGMVRQMLYHVLHPKAPLFRGGGLHEMVGRMMVRGS